MTAENEVRAAWEWVEDNEYLELWSTHWPPTKHEWEYAAEMTRQRQQEIAEIEEEIAWMESKFWPNPARNAIPLRILTRLQTQLAELKKGMK